MRLYNNLGVIQVLPLSAQAPMLIVATYNGDEEAGVTWMDYGQIETLHAALGDWHTGFSTLPGYLIRCPA